MPRTTHYAFELCETLSALRRGEVSGLLRLEGQRGWTTLHLSGGVVVDVASTAALGSPAYAVLPQSMAPSNRAQRNAPTEGAARGTEVDLIANLQLSESERISVEQQAKQRAMTHAFALEGSLQWEPGAIPVQGTLAPPNLFLALFEAAGMYPQKVRDTFDVQALSQHPGSRGAHFFRLSPLFERVFGPHRLMSVLETDEALEGGLSGDERDKDVQTFVLWMSGMVRLRGLDEPPVFAGLDEPRHPPVDAVEAAPTVLRTRRHRQRTTQGRAVNPLAPTPDEEWPSRRLEERSSASSLTLLEADILNISAWSERADDYTFLGLTPLACLSATRRALQVSMRRYDIERFEYFAASGSAARAILALRKRTEAAFDTVNDPLRRCRLNASLGVMSSREEERIIASMFEAEGLFKAGVLALKQGEVEEATELIIQARDCFEHDPEHEAYLIMAQGHTRRASDGDINQTMSRLVDLTKRHPDNERGWHFLGRTYEESGRRMDAILAYQRALHINPENATVEAALREIIRRGDDCWQRITSPLKARLSALKLEGPSR